MVIVRLRANALKSAMTAHRKVVPQVITPCKPPKVVLGVATAGTVLFIPFLAEY